MATIRVALFKLDPPYPDTPTNYRIVLIATAQNGEERAFQTYVPIACKDSKGAEASNDYIKQEALANVKELIAAWENDVRSTRPIDETPLVEVKEVQDDIAAKKAKL